MKQRGAMISGHMCPTPDQLSVTVYRRLKTIYRTLKTTRYTISSARQERGQVRVVLAGLWRQEYMAGSSQNVSMRRVLFFQAWRMCLPMVAQPTVLRTGAAYLLLTRVLLSP
ncbi:unnamed protein product [Discosporangium mesarthrocarpum]